VLHPPRNPGGAPEIDFFNFQNPFAGRNNAIQGAADDFSVVRLIEGFEHVDPPQRIIRFDPERIYFFGHSQGGLTGPPFIAYEPQVKGAVLSGAGGLLYYALLNKSEPVDITSIVKSVIIDNPLDEFNPVLALLQCWIERSDAINYGPMLVREPAPGLAPRPIYQSMGYVDHFTPLPTIEALAVSIGGDHVGPVIEPIEGLALRGRQEVSPPVTGNLGGTTAVVVQYQNTLGDGHFVVFDVAAARRQSTQFLSTLAETGAATLVPPP
jgi:pimeloyl-ACP methyl ester carboxylesterase